MNPDVWKLHAAVFELARDRYLGSFRVDTKMHPGGAVVELVLEGSRSQRSASPSRSPSCAVAPR